MIGEYFHRALLCLLNTILPVLFGILDSHYIGKNWLDLHLEFYLGVCLRPPPSLRLCGGPETLMMYDVASHLTLIRAFNVSPDDLGLFA